MGWFVVAIVLAIVLVVGIWFLHRFYAKANREIALVRTGLGGQKVVLDGGCLALPFLHKVAEVNMRTSKLEIERVGPASVITADRLRVDVGAEFYVRVRATREGGRDRRPGSRRQDLPRHRAGGDPRGQARERGALRRGRLHHGEPPGRARQVHPRR